MKVLLLAAILLGSCAAQPIIGYFGQLSDEWDLMVRVPHLVSMPIQVVDLQSPYTSVVEVTSSSGSIEPLRVLITSRTSFLVTWRGTQGVVVEEFIKAQGVWAVSQVVSGFLAGLSAEHALAYDHLRGELIVLDNEVGLLRGGNWQVGSPLGSVSWLTLADITTEPRLRAVSRILPTFLWVNDNLDPTGRALRLSQSEWGASAHLWRVGMIIRGSIYAPSFSPLPGDDSWIQQAPPVFDGASLVEGASAVIVSAYPGRAFEVKDEAGVVVGVGINNALVTQDVVVPLSRTLAVGETYGVSYLGSQVAQLDSVYRVYGIPGCSSTTGLCFQAHRQNLSLSVGNDLFRFRFGLIDSSPSGSWTSLSGVALAGVAAGAVTGNDPVLFLGPHALLDLSATVLLPVTITVDESGHGQAWIDAPIPNDPLLAGAVLLFQVAVDDGGGVILSQVIGQMVKP